MSMWQDVCRFHQQFNIPRCSYPDFPEEEMMKFRIKFIQEELEEFTVAYHEKDVPKAFDALIDLVYVVLGTAYIMNLPWEKGWKHVQAANMLKQRATSEVESKRKTTLDVVKPEGWVAPDDILRAEILKRKHEALLSQFIASFSMPKEIAKNE